MGDEVMAVDPKTRQFSLEKITFKYDHGKDKQDLKNSFKLA